MENIGAGWVWEVNAGTESASLLIQQGRRVFDRQAYSSLDRLVLLNRGNNARLQPVCPLLPKRSNLKTAVLLP